MKRCLVQDTSAVEPGIYPALHSGDTPAAIAWLCSASGSGIVLFGVEPFLTIEFSPLIAAHPFGSLAGVSDT